MRMKNPREKIPSWRLRTIALASVLLLTLSGCANLGLSAGDGSETANLETVAVSRGSIENRIVANGRVIATTSATLTFSRVGRIAEVAAREGQRVKKGEVLARLETRELEIIARQQEAAYVGALASYSQTVRGATPSEIAQARSELAAASQRFKDLNAGPTRASIADVQAALQAAEAEVKRAQSGYDSAFANDPAGIGASPEAATLEQKTIAFKQAKARLDAAYEKPRAGQYSDARAAIVAAQAKLTALTPVSETVMQRKASADQALYAWEQARYALREAELRAPFDGLVTAVGFAVGDTAGSAASIQLAEFDKPLFEVDVDEGDLGKVLVGQEVRVRLQSYASAPFSGTVMSIGSVGRQNGSVINYRVRVTIAQQAEKPVLLNMSGTAQIVTARADDALLVPARALTLDNDTKLHSVVRLRGEITETLTVTLGLRNADSVEVRSGNLNEGDTLVVPSDVPTLQVF
jgi:HlyD family secretion protein